MAAVIKIHGGENINLTDCMSIGGSGEILEASDVKDLFANNISHIGSDAIGLLRSGSGFLANTSDDELASLILALRGKSESAGIVALKKTPFWERWLQDGANIATITSLLAQLRTLIP